ncbi:FAD binding domain-containing protein [Phreatobacter cathodiphilus]|uniref:FAD-binding molybdopterin dehydrogenase n=1 Tax=Phreatobacter cathodiphilus TaxID=1868589 RepID=A0A2S0N7R0_9HYPH|nr:FAD binding domain-containing protein [Phreatobacter cathodiphilus]AVO43971.1 FAD-binding molybdopterin dehydrogenase [Phreatobacter cathodiphilus]
MSYFRPTSLAEAIAIKAGKDVTVLAGGTDVYPVRTARRAWGDPAHKPILDITAVPGLKGIAEEADHVRLGALTTWSDLARADLPPLFDGWRRAAREVGGLQVQNLGTLAGNLVTASPAGDGIPNLMALDAMVEVVGKAGTRALPVQAFSTGYRTTALAPDEIVTALIVPKLAGARSTFLKLGARKYLVISIAMVAAVIATDEAGRITAARIAVGACSAVAQRLTALEVALVGRPLAEAAGLVISDHLAALQPIDDVRATAAYRRAAAEALVRDALADLASPAARRAA